MSEAPGVEIEQGYQVLGRRRCLQAAGGGGCLEPADGYQREDQRGRQADEQHGGQHIEEQEAPCLTHQAPSRYSLMRPVAVVREIR